MVAIARALMAKPRLLLIDELSLGLAPVIIDNLLNIALYALTTNYKDDAVHAPFLMKRRASSP